MLQNDFFEFDKEHEYLKIQICHILNVHIKPKERFDVTHNKIDFWGNSIIFSMSYLISWI